MNKNKGGSRIRVEKLQDAHNAGTKKSKDCYLFLTEGDSAKSTAISGFSMVGRENYGVFPLKGKLLNVRDSALSKIREDGEIIKIITALGLTPGKKANVNDLRYGKLVVMSDADTDGIHIKGLVINLLNTFWPELLEQNFLYEFITPIIRAKRKGDARDFYSLDAYHDAKAKGELDGWKVKYYKGLGTITPEEIKAMFKDIDQHLIPFKWNDGSNEAIDKAFNKKRADDRKEWLLDYKGEIVPAKLGKPNRVTDFFDLEFIQYSMADNVRSIPNYIDGLKPSQRKILYTCFKRNLVEELKVAQLSGAVAEISAYHHGEQSLNTTIVGMAQDFVGSNNVPLLVSDGQFGTRLVGGTDSSAPRYIFTKLTKLTRLIFRPEDDAILNYLNDDGYLIEPEHYIPVVPMVLVNGSHGVGTGWSTDVPMYNIASIIKVLKHKLDGGTKKYRLSPYYNGFKGEILMDDVRYYSQGVLEKNKHGYLVTELPVYTWTDKYCEMLEEMVDLKTIKGYKNYSTDISVKIQINCDHVPDPIKALKLRTSINVTNINAFVGNRITLFSGAEELLDAYYIERLRWYDLRKDNQLSVMRAKMERALNVYNFVKYIIDGGLKVSNRSRADIESDMERLKLVRLEDSYDYLLNLPIHSLTKERMNKAEATIKDLKTDISVLESTSIEDMWKRDLDELEAAL